MDEFGKSVTMKRIFFSLAVMMFSISVIYAQGNRPGFEKYMEKFKAERVSYLTEKLDLSVEEAQKFWPLYNEYQDKRDKVIRSKRMEGRHGDFSGISSEELEAMADKKVEEELKLAQMKMEFHKEVKKVLPIEKVVLLYKAEMDFMNHMFNRLRDERPGEGQRGRYNRGGDREQ